MYRHDEEIVAIKKENIGIQWKNGIIEEKEVMETVFRNYEKSMFSATRGELEFNPVYIQPVCYIVIRKGATFYVYERLVVGGEGNNLFGVHSIGVGGHMIPQPSKPFKEIVYENMKRRFRDEIHMSDKELSFEIVGMLMDNSTLTNSCHIGIIGLMEISEKTVVSEREIELMNGQWLTLEELNDQNMYHRMESWSQMVIDFMTKKV